MDRIEGGRPKRLLTLNSCWGVGAVSCHNHTSTICGSSSGGRFNWIKPGYKLRTRLRTSLSDLELIESLDL